MPRYKPKTKSKNKSRVECEYSIKEGGSPWVAVIKSTVNEPTFNPTIERPKHPIFTLFAPNTALQLAEIFQESYNENKKTYKEVLTNKKT